MHDEILIREASALGLLAASEEVCEAIRCAAKHVYDAPRFVTTGIGKSGHVAVNLAGTLNCLGVPAHFLHPAEAYHGDLGTLTGEEAVIALSASGATEEVVSVAARARERGCKTVGVMGEAGHALSVVADVSVATGFGPDAEAFGVIPTVSLVTQLAVCHALAVGIALLHDPTENGMQRINHPGGYLGSRLGE